MKTILIIEDDFIIRDNLRELLELKGYKVYLTAGGNEGINVAREIKPHLIICDIIMHGLNGYEVKQKLEQDNETKSIPFVFLTAKADVKDIRFGMDSGADDYITKPYKANELLNTIENRIKRINELKNFKDNFPAVGKEFKPGEERIIISEKNKQQVIKYDEIVFISAAGDYTYIYLTSGKRILVRKLLGQREKNLPLNIFFRVHKSTMVNLNYVERIEKLEKKTSVAKMKYYDEQIIISQRNLKKLKSNLSSYHSQNN